MNTQTKQDKINYYQSKIDTIKAPYEYEEFEMPLYLIDEINYYESKLKELIK